MTTWCIWQWHELFEAWHPCAARPPPQPPQLALKHSTMEEHRQQMSRRGARSQFFMRPQHCMVHGKAMSSLRLGTLGARPPPPPHQVSAKESKVEKHEPKNKKRYARSQLSTRRRDCMMHGQGVRPLRLGTLGAKPPPQSPQLVAKESTMEELCSGK